MKKLLVVCLVFIGLLTILVVVVGLGVGFGKRLIKGSVPEKHSFPSPRSRLPDRARTGGLPERRPPYPRAR